MPEQIIGESIARYHELLGARHLASTQAALDACGDRIDCHVLRPLFVDEATYAQVLRVSELLTKALDTASDRLARDAALRRKLGIPDYIDALLALDAEHGQPSLMGRFDGIVDRSGVFRIFEYNSVPSFDNAAFAIEAFASMPITRELGESYGIRSESLFERSADTLATYMKDSGKTGLPVIGLPIVTDDTAPEQPPQWLKRFEARGAQVITAPYEDFVHEGGRLVANGVAIDLLLPRQSQMLARIGRPSAVFDAIKAGSVRLVFGLSRGFLASYKNTFELLTSPEYASLFEPEVATALTRHVPWTRVLRPGPTSHRGARVDLLPFLVQSREHMVLKPSGGRMGADIVPGWRVNDAAWKAALKRALGRNYVVQERVLGASEPFPKRSVAGLELETASATVEPFVWNGRAAGALARVSTIGVHNLADGCSVVPVWSLSVSGG